MATLLKMLLNTHQNGGDTKECADRGEHQGTGSEVSITVLTAENRIDTHHGHGRQEDSG